MSVTLLTLDERLCRAIGDWVQFDTTTNITTNNSVISTALRNYDHGQDEFFTNKWLYIEEGNNLGVERLVYDYLTSTGTLSVRGAALAAETGAVTCRITSSSWDDRKSAINDALRETAAYLHQKLDDRTLVTGNILPNSSFEDWTLTTIPDYWTASGTATVAENTTAGLHRTGTSSAKLTAGAASDYFYISSINYERLLDLAGKTVSLKVWAYPEVANDATITIYTEKADGTTQTLTSTTACPAGKWTQLELNNQTINEDIVLFQVRLGVTTNSKYAYFEDARLIGGQVYEYVLPLEFQVGKVSNVSVQYAGDIEDIAKDSLYAPAYGWEIVDDGIKYLRLNGYEPYERRIRIVGYTPFTVTSSGTSTVAISDQQANLLVEYAAYLLYSRMAGIMSADDSTKFYQKAQEHLMKWNSLVPRLRMALPQRQAQVKPL